MAQVLGLIEVAIAVAEEEEEVIVIVLVHFNSLGLRRDLPLSLYNPNILYSSFRAFHYPNRTPIYY